MKRKAIIHKEATKKLGLKKRIKELKGALLADYGNSVLTEMEIKNLNTLKSEGWRVRIQPEEPEIQINGFHFNSDDKKLQSNVRNSKKVSLPNGRSHHLVRLAGPIHKSWIDKMKKIGITIHEQVRANVYLISLDNTKIANLKRWKFVESLSPYFGQLKINENLLTNTIQNSLVASSNLKKVTLKEPLTKKVVAEPIEDIKVYRGRKQAAVQEVETLELVLFKGSDSVNLLKELKQNGCEVVHQLDNCLIVKASLDNLPQIAVQPEIKEINPYDEIHLHNNVATGIINGQVLRNDLELDGNGQIIAIGDSGLDTGVDDATMLADFAGRIVNIYPLGRPGDASDPDGHGTHVAGSVLGDGSNSNGNLQGLAPSAQVVFQSLMDSAGGLSGIPADLGVGLFDIARDDGAKIHTNSWGADVNGAYNFRSTQADIFAFNNREFLILFSAGNDAPNGIGSPGTAKNVLTVGASESVRTLPATVNFPASPTFPGGATANGLNTQADNQNQIAGFSSLGPAQNNRIKPDVVAPGSWILSTRSSVAVYDSGPDGLGPNEAGPGGTGDEDGVATHDEAVGLGLPGQGIFRMGDQNTPTLPAGSGAGAFEDYMYLSGTSMATPIMAGSCALLRQYLIEQRGHTPSASLIKALVVNGALDMGINNTLQGWGRSDLSNTLLPAGTERVQFDDTLDNALATGDFKTYNVHVASSSEPMVVTLVWRDPAGSTIQNQLFLKVTHIATSTEFTFETEGSPVLNNVQKIVIPAPASGIYEIEVEALSVTQEIPEFPGQLRQDYALVVANAVGFSCNPSDLVQVLDKSGSMGFYGYMEPAKQRASEVVDILKINDAVGVVSFAASSAPSTPTPLTNITSQTDKNTIKGTIAGISAGGNTDLRESLEDGLTTLGPDMGRPRAMIFLSDGQHTVPTAAIDNAFLDGIAAQNVKVYTIALGPASDFGVLDNIASRTGTGSTYTVDSAATLYKLHEVYYDIMGAMGCGSIVHLNSAPLITGQTREDKVFVDKSAREATFMISWEMGHSTVKTVLRSPSGKEFKPGSAGVMNISGDTYQLYKLALPEPGVWSVAATGRNSDQSRKTTIGAIVESEVKCRVDYRVKNGTILIEAQPVFRGEKVEKIGGHAVLSFPSISIDELLEKYKDKLRGIKVNKRLLKGASDDIRLAQLNIMAAKLGRKGIDIFERFEKKIKLDDSGDRSLSLKLDVSEFNLKGGGDIKLHITAKGDFGKHVCTKIIPLYLNPKKKKYKGK